MSTLYRTVFLGFQVAALVATTGPASAPLAALAAPIPAPLMPHLADYASQPPARNSNSNNATAVAPAGNLSAAPENDDVAVVKHTTSSVARRDADASYDALLQSSGLLSGLASESSNRANDPAFSGEALVALTNFKNNLELVIQLLDLDFDWTDRGLAEYDQDSKLETCLKDIINANKDAFSATNKMVFNIPTLGPDLGPVVYEIKCILDGLLNTIEVLTDSLLNNLLLELIAELTTFVCNLAADLGLGALCRL